MLSLHATTSPTSLLAPTPLPGAANHATDGSNTPSAFARMLQGSQPPAAAASAPPAPQQTAPQQPKPAQQPQRGSEQQASAPQAQHPAERPNEAQAEPATHGQASAANTAAPATNRPAAAGRDGTRGRDEAKRAQAAHTSAAQAATAQAEATKRASAAADDDKDLTTPANPALADWLAGLKLPDPPQAAQPAALAAGATAGAPTDPNHPGAPTATPGNASAAPGADAASAAACGQAAAASLAAGLPAAAGKAAGDTAAATAGRERNADLPVRGAGPREGHAGDPAGAALAANPARPGVSDGQTGASSGGNAGGLGNAPPAWTPVASTPANAAAVAPTPVAMFTVPAPRSSADPVAVNLPVPVDSPEFPRAMGVELAVLARNGIEHAELHLSPAEMGPVSVQIAIDGTLARIDFGADVASTRQAIEAGLPELAGALRDAGLTLTGGGVSQHSRGRGDAPGAGNGGQVGNGQAEGGGGDANAAPSRRVVRAGGVDMYA